MSTGSSAERSDRTPATTEAAGPSAWRRLGWFVLLYLAGLAAAGALVYLLRILVHAAFAVH